MEPSYPTHEFTSIGADKVHARLSGLQRHTCHLWAHSRPTYTLVPTYTDTLPHTLTP